MMTFGDTKDRLTGKDYYDLNLTSGCFDLRILSGGGLFKYHDDDLHTSIIRFDQNFDCSQLPHMDEFSSDAKGKPA